MRGVISETGTGYPSGGPWLLHVLVGFVRSMFSHA